LDLQSPFWLLKAKKAHIPIKTDKQQVKIIWLDLLKRTAPVLQDQMAKHHIRGYWRHCK
jgi:hypothetical protein